MRALAIEAFGPPESIRLIDVPAPAPQDEEIRIKVAFAGVNPADWKEIAGLLSPFATYRFPFVPGFEGAGTVERLGAAVSGIEIGDRVMFASGIGQPGAWAEQVCIDRRQAYPIPAWLNFSDAAVLPTGLLTAYQDMFAAQKGALKRGDLVLIHGGAGGVGGFAIPMAKHFGLAVAATCSTRNVSYVRALGADCIIDYTRQEVVAALRQWSAGGVDAIINAVGEGTLPDALDGLKPGGRLVSIATITDDGDVEAQTREAARRGFRKIFAFVGPEDMANGKTPIAELVRDRIVPIPPVEIFERANASAALLKSKTGHVRGKLCLRMGVTN